MARQAQLMHCGLLAQCIMGSGGYFPSSPLEFQRSIHRKTDYLGTYPAIHLMFAITQVVQKATSS